MGFTSQDDLITQITAGKYLRREGSKLITPADTAGGWRCLMGMAGNPVASTFPGTTLLWQNCDENVGDGTNIFGINNGGAVSPATKHIINVGALLVAAAGAPWQAKLVDLQGYYRLSGTDVTGTGSRTLINSNTVTFSSSSGLLATFTNDFASGTKVRFTTSGALPTGLAINTDYWLVRVSATTARIATSYANYVAGTVIAFTDAGTPTTTMTIQMPGTRKVSGVSQRSLSAPPPQPVARTFPRAPTRTRRQPLAARSLVPPRWEWQPTPMLDASFIPATRQAGTALSCRSRPEIKGSRRSSRSRSPVVPHTPGRVCWDSRS